MNKVTTNQKEMIQIDDKVIKNFDVRGSECIERITAIFNSFEELKPGEAFIFTNDHDPKPVYFKLKENFDEPIQWDYLKTEPGEWVIRVSKSETAQ